MLIPRGDDPWQLLLYIGVCRKLSLVSSNTPGVHTKQWQMNTSVQRACQYLDHIDVEIMHEEVLQMGCNIFYSYHT